MNTEREPSVRVVADAALETAADRPESQQRERVRGERLGAVVGLMALAVLVLAVAVTYANPPRPAVGDKAAGTPAPTRDPTTLSDQEKWGRLWSQLNGTPVIRPTWLPKTADEYFLDPSDPTLRGFPGYIVSYTERHAAPFASVWHLDFYADPVEGQGPGRLFPVSAPPEPLTVRGHPAELSGMGAPFWQLAWTEGAYRYAIVGFAMSREDFLRVVASLALVIDEAGTTR